MTPWINNKTAKGAFPCPCGKCPNCKKRRTSGWSFRLCQEEKYSQSAYFITLTYDTLHVPISERGRFTVRKTDLQKFFKRLRKAHSRKARRYIRYYAVAEYGGMSYRPHYHILLFNADIELIQNAWGLCKEKKIQQIGKRGKPIKKWHVEKSYVHFGKCHYGSVTSASVGYSLKYMSKKPRIPQFQNDDRQPEFATMSIGIGRDYLTPNMLEWHKADLANRMYCNVSDGKKIAMPRYYKQKIYNEIERMKISDQVRKRQEKRQADEIRKKGARRYWDEIDGSIAAAFKKQHYLNQVEDMTLTI